jgi:predicted nucleic acid-binding protein
VEASQVTYPGRLIEVDLPIQRICAHARREKSIRHGPISTLHIWWARRPLASMANWLRRHPADVQRHRRHRQAIDDLAALPIPILPVSGAQVSRAADLSLQQGLLTNNALIVAVMQDNGLTAIASVDTDFDRVPGITRYAPV